MLHENPSDQYTAWVRRCVFGMWLVNLLVAPLVSLAELPAEVLHFPVPLRLLPRHWQLALLDSTALRIFQLLAVTLTAMCIPRRTWRWAVVPCAILLTMHQSLIRGMGHMNHAEIPLLLATYVFAVRAVGPRSSRNFEPLAIAWILMVTYMLTGTFRVANGGLSVFTSDSIAYWSVENSLRQSYFDVSYGAFVVSHPLVIATFKIGFAMATAFEVTAPWAIVSGLYRRAFVPVMFAFHIGVLLTMNIVFWETLALLMLLLVFPIQGKRAPQDVVTDESLYSALAMRKWSIIAFGIAVCCVAVLWMIGVRPLAVELALWTGVLWPLARNLKLQDFAQAIPRSTLAAIGMLSVLIFAGHAYCKPQRTFPFVPWWMYSASTNRDLVTLYRVQATTITGEKVSINPERLYPAFGLGRARLVAPIKHMASRMERRTREREHLLALLRSFASSYAARHDVKLRCINLVRVECSYLTPHELTETPVLTIELDGD